MLVGIVGGLDGARSDYVRVADASGHEVVFHDGQVGALGWGPFVQLLDRCDVIVVVTDGNDAGVVEVARYRLRAQGRSPLLLRRCGVERLESLLATLTVREKSAAFPTLPPPSG